MVAGRKKKKEKENFSSKKDPDFVTEDMIPVFMKDRR